jgi:hypothetical protein
MIQRRGFLAGLGALLAAPAVIRTPGLLMPVKRQLILWGDGIHDDTAALQAMVDRRISIIPEGIYRITSTIEIGAPILIHGCSFLGECAGPILSFNHGARESTISYTHFTVVHPDASAMGQT